MPLMHRPWAQAYGAGLNAWRVVAVTGVATRNPAAPGGVEVTEPRITLLGEPAQVPPVDVWRPAIDAGLPAILDHAAVSWRHPARRARWELAAGSLRGFRAALDALGFTEIQTPKLVSSATESVGAADKAWMSQPCRSSCMNGTFTSNDLVRAGPE
jgi:aspartyl/asparaginyl-tRNA synthetase